MNSSGVPPELLRRYLAGECSPAERRRVDAWYRGLDKRAGAGAPPAFDERALFSRIRADLTDDESFGQPLQSPAPVRPLWSRPAWTYVAAGTAAVALLVGGLLLRPARRATPAVVATRTERAAPVTYQNRTRKVLRQTLPDGSVVWLNPGAQLALTTPFGRGVRAVQFRGEAFFDVAKDTARPFVIRSGRMTTQVLGTSFNVNAPGNGAKYEVSVVTGRVAVSAATASGQLRTVLLKPQQQATYRLTTRELAMNVVTPKATENESWQPVSLSFDDATLAETVRQLERAFAVQITLANPELAHCRLTVDFNQQRLPEILEMMDKLLGTEYALVGDRIVLTGRGCAREKPKPD